MYYIDNLSPFALEFFPGFGIRWYGLAYVMGFLAGWWILIRIAREGFLNLDAKGRANFLFAIIMGVLIGGRLGYMLFYRLDEFLANPLSFLRIWEGGMSSHGGFIGVALACLACANSYKVKFLTLADAICVAAPVGLFFGRLANFVNGELWGKIAYLPWAVIFPRSAPEGTPLSLIAPRHPSQLYEAALEGLLLFIYAQLRYRSTMKTAPGQLSAEFLILYAVVRIFCELFREPDAALIMGVSRGIFYSLILIPIGLALWFWTRRKNA